MPVVEVHLSNVDEREEWRRVLGDRRPRREPRDRQGPGRLPGGARVPGAASADEAQRRRPRCGRCSRSRCSSRSPSTSRYLTGLSTARTPRCSSSRTGVRLFTDFRYVEKARGDRASRSSRRARDLVRGAARARSPAASVRGRRADLRALGDAAAGGLELVPRVRARRGRARGQGRRRARRDPPRRRDHERALRAARRASRSSAGRERELAWRLRVS